MKTCGECTTCCKVIGVSELQKPSNHWCPHADHHKGCTIYETRPKSCREFECYWLQHDKMPDYMRPDKVHAVFTGTVEGNALVARLDPGYPAAHHQEPLRGFLLRLVNNGVKVIVCCGHKMYYYRNGRWNLGEVTLSQEVNKVTVPGTTV